MTISRRPAPPPSLAFAIAFRRRPSGCLRQATSLRFVLLTAPLPPASVLLSLRHALHCCHPLEKSDPIMLPRYKSSPDGTRTSATRDIAGFAPTAPQSFLLVPLPVCRHSPRA